MTPLRLTKATMYINSQAQASELIYKSLSGKNYFNKTIFKGLPFSKAMWKHYPGKKENKGRGKCACLVLHIGQSHLTQLLLWKGNFSLIEKIRIHQIFPRKSHFKAIHILYMLLELQLSVIPNLLRNDQDNYLPYFNST